MRFLIAGAGAIGGYMGALMSRAGLDVTLFARGAHLAAMRDRGLRVLSADGDFETHPRVIGDLAEAGTPDVIILGVKAHGLTSLAPQLAAIIGPETTVVSTQNGLPWWYFQLGAGEHNGLVLESVDPGGIIGNAIPPARVLGSIVYLGTEVAEPGVIRHTGTMQRLVFGEFDGQRSPRLRAVAQACEAAGITHELSDQIRRSQWEKFVFLVGLSATTTAARVPIGVIRSHPRSRALLHDLMDEVVQVARAEGVDLPPDFAAQRLAFADGLPATMTASMHHDLQRGSRLELPWLSGDVVARGLRLGVPTPCNRAIVDLLAVHADGAPAVTLG